MQTHMYSHFSILKWLSILLPLPPSLPPSILKSNFKIGRNVINFDINKALNTKL